MEPLWSPVVATDGNQWRIRSARKPQTSEIRCRGLPPVAARSACKEGIDGSSPSEACLKALQMGIWCCLRWRDSDTSRVRDGEAWDGTKENRPVSARRNASEGLAKIQSVSPSRASRVARRARPSARAAVPAGLRELLSPVPASAVTSATCLRRPRRRCELFCRR